MQSVEITANEIAQLLSFHDTYDQIEILANVLIFLGTSKMNVDSNMSPDGLISFIFKDKKERGETIENALAHQGLLMFSWLEKTKK